MVHPRKGQDRNLILANNIKVYTVDQDNYEQESPADAVKPARRKSMQKLLQFDVFRFISPYSISPNLKV